MARGPGEAFSATGGVEIWSERQEGSTVAAKLWHDVNEIYKKDCFCTIMLIYDGEEYIDTHEKW